MYPLRPLGSTRSPNPGRFFGYMNLGGIDHAFGQFRHEARSRSDARSASRHRLRPPVEAAQSCAALLQTLINLKVVQILPAQSPKTLHFFDDECQGHERGMSVSLRSRPGFASEPNRILSRSASGPTKTILPQLPDELVLALKFVRRKNPRPAVAPTAAISNSSAAGVTCLPRAS
jgi:hypothetical protein